MYASRSCAASEARSSCSLIWLRVCSARSPARRRSAASPAACNSSPRCRFAAMTSSASRTRALKASRSLSSAPMRSVSSAMRARTAASLAFAASAASACAGSARLLAAPPALAHSMAASTASTHGLGNFRYSMAASIAVKHTSLVPAAILARPKNPYVRRMQRLFEFIGHHPYLAAGAVLAAVVVAVYEIRERMQAFAALSSLKAVRLMNQGALVIDLRGKESYDAGHIGDARNVPAAELESRADSLKKWRDKTVITYCDSGTSGANGARAL